VLPDYALSDLSWAAWMFWGGAVVVVEVVEVEGRESRLSVYETAL
jgi:hypothetical protein